MITVTQDNANTLLMSGFAILMLFVFCHALKLYYRNNRVSAVNFYANTLTSLGILGTFVGIALGILYFDTQAIDKSLVLMIEGLKTAFLTSIGGLGLSILLKQLTYHKPNQADRELEFGEEPNLVVALEQQTQLIIQSMDQFQHHVANNIVNELALVVRDFNNRIAQQFGSNVGTLSAELTELGHHMSSLDHRVSEFDQQVCSLSDSIQSFDNLHRQSAKHIERLLSGIESTNTSLEQSASLVKSNEDNTALLQQGAQHATDLLEQVQNHLAGFEQQLEQFNASQWNEQSQVTEAFTESFSRLESQLLTAMEQASATTVASSSSLIAELNQCATVQQDLSQQLSATTDIQRTANQQLLAQMAQLGESTESVTTKNRDYVDEVFQRSLQQLDNAYQQQSELLATSRIDAQIGIDQAVAQLNDQHEALLASHYQSYETFLKREMETSLKQISDVMGFVSGEFARDFQQLIAQMQTVQTEFKRQLSETHE